MEKRHAIIVVMVAACYLSQAMAVETTATFRPPPYTPTACFQDQDRGSHIVAVSNSTWQDGAICGKAMNVTCTGVHTFGARQTCKNTFVVVTIADRCYECDEDTVKLSQDAYDVIAFHDIERIKIDYVMLSESTAANNQPLKGRT